MMQRTEGENYGVDIRGNRIYVETPLPTKITADAMNAIQEEICNAITASGQEILTSATDTREQLASAIATTATVYQLVFSQISFNALWERVSANVYKLKDGVKSVYVRYILGGYRLAGVGSPLSGGDTWGQYQTNNCSSIYCEGGTVFEKVESKSYVTVNTADCKIENIVLNTSGAASVDHIFGFALSASNVQLIGCGVQGFTIINEGNDFIAFDCAGNIARLENCFIKNVNYSDDSANNFYGIQDSNFAKSYFRKCSIDNCELTTDGEMVLFDTLKNISGTYINDILFDDITGNTGTAKCFDACININGVVISVLSTTVVGSKFYGFDTCNRINNVELTIDTTNDWAGDFYGFSDSNYINNVDYVGGKGRRKNYGFDNCDFVNNISISGWEAPDTDSGTACHCFLDCNNVSNCFIDDIVKDTANVIIFITCDRISNISITNCISEYSLCIWIFYTYQQCFNRYVHSNRYFRWFFSL